MTDRVQQLADQATHGGAVIAGAAFFSLAWWNENSPAVVGICGVIGATCSVIGLGVAWWYRHKQIKESND